MLSIAGYIIDRVVGLDERESQATLTLASGIVCTIPTQDRSADGLLEWARAMLAFNAPIALQIVEGVVVDAANHFQTAVMALSPEGESPVKVNLWGKSGTYRFAGPEVEREYLPQLARSLATQRKLLFLVHVSIIQAAVDLSADEIGNLQEMSSHRSPFEYSLNRLLPHGQ